MRDLFKVEVLRFRGWAIAYATLHLMALGFMTRLVDLAQQPLLVYRVIAALFALTGVLLGVYQMGSYRRPNAWLNLLHRPVPHWHIAIALLGAGALMLAAAILVPLLVIAGWQESMTARVVDSRHLWLALSGLLISLCAYLAGACAVLANKRYGFCAFIFLGLLAASNATGPGAIALQLLVLVWLSAMVYFAFKPDLSAPPRSAPGALAVAAPLQFTVWFALLMLGFGIELLWIMQGTHPNNRAMPPTGSAQEANRAESRDLMIAGLASSSAAQAPLWREQAAISEIFGLDMYLRRLPVRNQLGNFAPMEFDDEARRVRWVFSHGSMRFEGYGLADSRAVGHLGVEGDRPFVLPPLPGSKDLLFDRQTVYQYDSAQKLILPRMRAPNGETLAGFHLAGESAALLTDRALYFYDGREMQGSDGPLHAQHRVPVPGKVGTLRRIDVMELLEGYLVSFTFTRGIHNGDGPSYQDLVQVDGAGNVIPVVHRELTTGFGPVFRYQSWYTSVFLFGLQRQALDLFSAYQPFDEIDRQPVPRIAWIIAGVLMLLSALAALRHSRRLRMSSAGKIAWVLACGILSVPALISLWLIYPSPERANELRVTRLSPAGKFAATTFVGMVCAMSLPTPSLAAVDAASLRVAAAAERSRPVSPQFDRVQFLAQSSLLGAWLSPNGRFVAALREEGGKRSVWLLAAGESAKRLLLDTDATRLSWTRDGHWLLLESPKQLYALGVAHEAGSRAIARLGDRPRRELFMVDPVRPAAAIVLETPPPVSRLTRHWRLFRVDMQGRQDLLHEDVRPIADAGFDAGGELRYVTYTETDRYAIYRRQDGRQREVLRCVTLERCKVLSVDAQGSLLLKTDIGANFQRLARLGAKGELHTLHSDPRGEADLDQVVLDPATGQPLMASYRSTIASNFGLTPDSTRHVDAIERHFPGRNLRIEAGSGPDARWLVHERSGSIKGERLHLYDPATRGFAAIFGDSVFQSDHKPVPELPEPAMARKIAISWQASDGLRLHGFLTLPPGRDASRTPLVANVHGGPFNLFRPEFNAVSQFLANRGYVVFEPNFRGSTGLGRNYLFAAMGDFGNGRVQQDIAEGVRWLLAQGIGDPDRVAITGASFGGYSVLQGLTFQPELFKVGVAAVPPADFGWVIRWYARSADQASTGISLATTMRMLSLDTGDRKIAERLRAQSPIVNAARMNRPVLLLAGGDDERVPIRSVTHYAAALRTLSKDVSLFIDIDGSHTLPSPLTREAYLYLTEDMFHRHLGGAKPKSPSTELLAHLRRNLRIAGTGMQL
jgi:dienelactone hydrolase